LRELTLLGYGGRLRLDLALNPIGAEMLGDREELTASFRDTLAARHGLSFHELVIIANMPLGRFGATLDQHQGQAAYLHNLTEAFNPATVPLLACRFGLVVSWDGRLYDCDFNLAAGLPCRGGPRTDAPLSLLTTRRLAFGAHCFACTADAGSS
jgi:hypothetical protein